jgi:putative Holliday junction resolvase
LDHPTARRSFDPAAARSYIAAVRYLGIDLGRARIGLALADDILRAARPLKAVQHRDEATDIAEIRAVARDFEVTRAVVGLPLNMDGSEGASARMARAFAPRLATALGVPVDLFDERLSTFEAEDRLRARGISARDRKAQVDAEAAAVILQGWLDGRPA